jgi:hypothetical protein
MIWGVLKGIYGPFGKINSKGQGAERATLEAVGKGLEREPIYREKRSESIRAAMLAPG